MKSMNNTKNKAFLNGRQQNGSTMSVSGSPLFIDARGKENRIRETAKWITRKICLLHGESFHWKGRCKRCRHLISFQTRR